MSHVTAKEFADKYDSSASWVFLQIKLGHLPVVGSITVGNTTARLVDESTALSLFQRRHGRRKQFCGVPSSAAELGVSVEHFLAERRR